MEASPETSPEQISNDRYTTLLLETAVKHVPKTRKNRLTLSNHTGLSVNNFVFVRLKPNQWFYSKTNHSKSVLESSAIFKNGLTRPDRMILMLLPY